MERKYIQKTTCAWSKTKVNTYRWRLIASNVASDSPAPSNLFCQRHRQRLNVSPATSPATRQLLPATSPATNQRLPATSPAIKKGSPATSPAINKRSPATSPATQQVIASDTRRCWRYRWQLKVSLATLLATQGVAGDSGCRWRLRVSLATSLAIRDVAGDSTGNTGRCWRHRWQHEALLATLLAT